MKLDNAATQLLLVGALPRLAIAGAVVLLLWLGFIWATAAPGGL